MDYNLPQNMWEASMQMFSYDANHPVHKLVIWNPDNWPTVTDTEITEFAARFIRKYIFEFERIGGWDPFQTTTNQQLQDMRDVLDNNPQGYTFEHDWAGWIPSEYPGNYPYPRFLYNAQVSGGSNLTCCGERQKEGVILEFTGGTAAMSAAAALSGPSGVTAVIESVALQSGTWAGGDAAGTLELSGITCPGPPGTLSFPFPW